MFGRQTEKVVGSFDIINFASSGPLGLGSTVGGVPGISLQKYVYGKTKFRNFILSGIPWVYFMRNSKNIINELEKSKKYNIRETKNLFGPNNFCSTPYNTKNLKHE